MLCPHDGDLLEHQQYFKYPRWACATCKGSFIHERDLSENLGHKKAPKSVEVIAGVKLDSVTQSQIRCPKDEALMRAVMVAGCEVDVCPSCKGLWLDGGEYDRIVRRMSERTEKMRGAPKAANEEGVDLTTPDAWEFLRGVWRSYKSWKRIL